MAKDLTVFNFQEGKEVRTTIIEGNPWWVANDVCDVLEITDSRQAFERLEDDEQGVYTIPTTGGIRKMRIINEPGLYSLIMRSNKPEAKAFKRWITHDVLPAIRKTGEYKIQKRKAADTRNYFTDKLKSHGCDAPIHYIKITATMKKNAGIKGNKRKDDFDNEEIATIMAAEGLASLMLLKSKADGYDQCKPICQTASASILSLIAKKPDLLLA